MKMSLRDDVRWVCDAADGLLIGWLPGRLPKWATKEGEKLGWLVLLLWRKFYEASMARINLEAEVNRLKDDVDGLRTTNERLTDLLDQPSREAVAAALSGCPSEPGYYWVRVPDGEKVVAYWDGDDWHFPGGGVPPPATLLSGVITPPATPP